MRLKASSVAALAFPLTLAALWGFHAAAFSYPGRAYFHVTGLNDLSKGLGVNILLHPAFVCAVLFAAFKAKSRPALPSHDGNCGIAVALGCWMLGATLSTLLNAHFDQVVLTYCVVFVTGLAVYWSLANRPVTAVDLEVGLIGLIIGSLFPLIGGLQAFVQEWGVPDIDTTLNAYRNLFRMEMYEAATFGNRGNTAAFIVILAPICLWVALDKSRSLAIRTACGVTLVPVLLNLAVLQVRATVLTLFFSLSVIWAFRLGLRRYPLFIAGFGITIMLFFQYSPDVAQLMSDRLRPVVTADSDEDASVMERAESLREGIATAQRNWQLGVGPGGALTRHSQTSAHQFQVQQFMETGILGLIGSAIFSVGVLLMLARTVKRGRDGGTNNIRFTLLIGPASFLVYGLLANPTFNVGYVNTWTVLMASMLALVPGLERAPRRRLGTAPARTRPVLQQALSGVRVS